MKAKEKGYLDGLAGNQPGKKRMYESDRANNNYWVGYYSGVVKANPGKRIVQCRREGKTFATDNIDDCKCPTCGRRYINGEADRPLLIIL